MIRLSFDQAAKCIIDSLVGGLKMGITTSIPHLAGTLTAYMTCAGNTTGESH